MRMLISLLACCSASTQTNGADDNNASRSLSNWYRVDLVIFKPKTADLDEENWSETIRSYPSDVTSVAPGEVLRLSQLEQQADALVATGDTEPVALAPDRFAFEGMSGSYRNRRKIESLDNDTPVPIDTPSPGNVIEDTIEIDELIASQNPTSFGKIAYSSSLDDSSLGSVAQRLKRSSTFELLSHQSWVQPISGESVPIMIQAGKRFDDLFEIEGTLAITLSRFLHVQTNLWYTQFEPKPGGSNPYKGPIATDLSDDMLSEHADLVKIERERGQYMAVGKHTMAQSRRMRSDETHYIDHPLFGVIIEINRYTFDVAN